MQPVYPEHIVESGYPKCSLPTRLSSFNKFSKYGNIANISTCMALQVLFLTTIITITVYFTQVEEVKIKIISKYVSFVCVGPE